MKHLILFIALIASYRMPAQTYQLTSPDSQLSLDISNRSELSFIVSFKGEELFENRISMTMSSNRILGAGKVKNTSENSIYESVEVEIPTKQRVLMDEYNELIISFETNYEIIFRAYNQGIGYRFVEKQTGPNQVFSEQMDIEFTKNTKSFFPQEESMYSHNERLYLNKEIKDIDEGSFCSLPVLFRSTEGTAILFSESSLVNYPGMFIQKSGEFSFKTLFPQYVLKAVPNQEQSPDRNQILEEEAEYIATIDNQRSFPWRIFVISDKDVDLLEQDLFYLMSEANQIGPTDWIKPGKVAWDWYNANNIFGVDFESGLNIDTYKYYIDFAAENGIEYVILDEGWTKSTTEILDFNPDIDLPNLMEYAKSKGVGIILWVLWKPLNDNMLEILDLYQSWGAKGIKVDFMQRSDQGMVASYEKIAKECAKRNLLVDYHGAFKPSGLRRMYPNILNYEGVKGTENNKWSADITPTHNVTIPFIRMAAGPMDYTPGSMRNAQLANYKISFTRPMSLGSRCHQIAMYIIYDAPLQMMCENPSIYKQEQETVDFITKIPTIWDETIALEASVSEYLVLARRNGEDWYLGAMTNEQPRQFEIELDFLGDGAYTMTLMRDGINASKYAEDYVKESRQVDRSITLKLELTGGGGFAAMFKPE